VRDVEYPATIGLGRGGTLCSPRAQDSDDSHSLQSTTLQGDSEIDGKSYVE
jgi:hypothetical protein